MCTSQEALWPRDSLAKRLTELTCACNQDVRNKDVRRMEVGGERRRGRARTADSRWQTADRQDEHNGSTERIRTVA